VVLFWVAVFGRQRVLLLFPETVLKSYLVCVVHIFLYRYSVDRVSLFYVESLLVWTQEQFFCEAFLHFKAVFCFQFIAVIGLFRAVQNLPPVPNKSIGKSWADGRSITRKSLLYSIRA